MMKPGLIALATICVLGAAACDRDASDPAAPDPAASVRPNAEIQGGDADDRAASQAPSQVPSSQGGVTAQTSFDLVDQDRDGLVSSAEASTVDGLDFAAADSDQSESLSRQEYALAMEAARPRG
jgi:hypothetical protein